MEDIIYFIPGKDGRHVSKRTGKVIIGDQISEEGYYVGTKVKKEECSIFQGKPYVPSESDIPLYVDFNPNIARAWIIQDSIRYLLVRHRKSSAYFAICRYLLYFRSKHNYFSDLLTFIDGKWKEMSEWPFEADYRNANSKISEYWTKYGNYYENDFEVIKELQGSCVPQGA